MKREQALVPKTLRNVLTPSVPLSVQSLGGCSCACVCDGVCTDGGVTAPVCLCVFVQPPDLGGREPTAGTEINQN